MISVYLLEEDKYGKYFLVHDKKRRLKTIDKNKIKYIIDGNYIVFGYGGKE